MIARFVANAAQFVGIVLMLAAWERDSGAWFALGAFLAWRGASELERA